MKEELLSCGLREKVCLTNRLFLPARLYSDNARMTSKRDKNKEERHEPQASSVTDILTPSVLLHTGMVSQET